MKPTDEWMAETMQPILDRIAGGPMTAEEERDARERMALTEAKAKGENEIIDHPLNLLHPSLGLAFTSEFGDTRWYESTAKCLHHIMTMNGQEDAEDLGGFPLGDDEE